MTNSTLTSSETSSSTAKLLTGKQAVIFAAGGAVGAALASEFAAQGASVFLSGRHLEPVERIATEVQGAGGTAQTATIDALDESAVTAYLDGVALQAGGIDVVVNAMGPLPSEYSNGRNTLELPLEHFMVPLTTLLPSQFITARAAARHMVKQGSGVILFISAVPSRGMANVSAIGSTFGAMESLARCLAVDLGPSGVRVVAIRSGAMVDTSTIQQSMQRVAQAMSISREQAQARLEQATLLKRLPVAADTARLAAFLASDGARAITGAIVNASSGAAVD
jgi:NAD(P)-dependent dehydrogenase (short-subunit alcohol dehydrogenase family)